MESIYAYPEYYDIAFSYRNIPAETTVMEEAMAKYSRIPVKTVLELACGNSPHMLEFMKRGYTYAGLDISATMLDFARKKAAEANCNPRFYQASFIDFELDEPVDFIYIMLGSLYVSNTDELLQHFATVEKALKPGGLYFLDWCVDFSPLNYTQDRWTMKRDHISVTTHYITRLHHAAEQLFTEEITLRIKDGIRQRRLVHRGLRRAIFPQEFLLAATRLNNFEFIGWWNDWNWHQPLAEVGDKEILRPITVLRRR